jgi:tol-pal system protein YbgF
MVKCQRALAVLVLSLPLAAWAELPVDETNAAYGSSGYPPAGYGTSGAYAGGGATAPVSAQGQLFVQLQQMQQELGQLRGMLEEQQNEIQRLKQEGLERYQSLDQRLSGGATGAPVTQNSPAAGAINASGAAVAPAANAAVSNESGDPAKEKLYYDASFELIKAKDFDKASQAFEAFLRKYPNSQYAGNAQYWLGEVNVTQGRLQAAAQAFAKVTQNYPKHTKVPDALYKQGDVEVRLGNVDKAKSIFQQLISQYPSSSAAQLAQRELKRL